MIRTIRKCPHCGTRTTTIGEAKKEIGSPFAICPFCKKNIILSNVREWNTMSKPKKFWFLIAPTTSTFMGLFTLFIIIGIIPCIYIPENLMFLNSIIIFFAAFIIFGGFAILKYKSQNIQDAIYLSNMRLGDPKYCELLKKCGFKIYKVKTNKK